MPGGFDPRAFASNPDQLIPLVSGLDLTTTPLFTQPGTLSDCVNVELVEDVLFGIQGTMELGTTALNRLPDDYYVLYGREGSDWSDTLDLDDYDLVTWFVNDEESQGVAGTGIVRYMPNMTGITNPDDKHSYALMHIEGETPEGYNSFYIESGGNQVEGLQVHSGYGWVLPSRYQAHITQNVHRQHNWNIHLDERTSAVWDTFRPKPLTTGAISHVFQLEDITYAVGDFLVGAFIDGVEEPSIGDEIEANNAAGTNVLGLVAKAEVVTGSWEGGDATGWLYLYPGSGTTLDETVLDTWLNLSSEVITNNTTVNQLGTTPAQTAPASQVNAKTHGIMWKLDTDGRTNTGWKYVDIGYSLEFNEGLVAPLAIEAPLVVTDQLSVLQDSGDVALVSPATEYPATGTYSAWTGLANLAADDASNCTSPVLALDYSRVIELQTTASLIPGDASIIGVEVTFEADQTVGTDAFIHKVQLRNDATGATQFLSSDKGDGQTLLAATPTVYTYGAQLDIFGFDELLQDTINDQDLTVLIQFGNGHAVTTRTVQVDYVNVKFHYFQKGQDVYIYDGSSDVTTGTLYAYQVHDGEWSTDDAKGWMTLHDVVTPSATTAGMQIRTAAAGAGDLIGTTVELTKNILPGYIEMSDTGTRSQYVTTSITGGEDNIKAFVANGVGPAFSLDTEDRFQFIRLPVDRVKDKPRYVSEQREHLTLALKEHLLISSVGSPNNFSTYDGATSWSIGDDITGLIPSPDNTLVILAQDSTHILSGSGATGQDAFRVSTHARTGGAKHYSGVYSGDATFLDDVGLSSLPVTDKFGDFKQGQLSYGIQSWLAPRLTDMTAEELPGTSGLLEMVPVRGKNQLRAYFNDGWIMTASFPPPGAQSPLPKFTLQNYQFNVTGTTVTGQGEVPEALDTYKPTSISSYVTSTGEERVVIGLADGRVMLIDNGLTVMTVDIEGGFAVNPIHGPNPNNDSINSNGMSLSYEKDHIARIKATSSVDYEPPIWTTSGAFAIAGNGAIQSQYMNRYDVGIAHSFSRDTTLAIAWRFNFVSDQSENLRPIKFIALSPDIAARSVKRARMQKSVEKMT